MLGGAWRIYDDETVRGELLSTYRDTVNGILKQESWLVSKAMDCFVEACLESNSGLARSIPVAYDRIACMMMMNDSTSMSDGVLVIAVGKHSVGVVTFFARRRWSTGISGLDDMEYFQMFFAALREFI